MIVTSRNGKKLNFLISGIKDVYVLDHAAFKGVFDWLYHNDWEKSAGRAKLQNWAEANLPDKILTQYDVDIPTVEEVFSQKMLSHYDNAKNFESHQLSIFKDSDNRMMELNDECIQWWTRSACSAAPDAVWCVGLDGCLGTSSSIHERGFVPVLRKKKPIDEEQECWGRLVDIAKEYAQKHMHPHKTIIITQLGIELLEGDKAAPFELLD